MEYLGIWADSEYRTVPQLVMVFVKFELKDGDKYQDIAPVSPDRTAPTETKAPSATKAKRGKGSKEAS